MEVGIIAPTKLLDKCCVTNIQYVLPRLIAEDETYRRFYIGRQKKGNIIILDTVKVGWRREPEVFSVVAEALQLVCPQYIVLPSYTYNLPKTLEVQKEFLQVFPLGNRWVPCLEGAGEGDILNFKASYEGRGVVAIPHYILPICRHLKGKFPIYIETHVSAEEVSKYKGLLVTSLPVRLGLSGRLLDQSLPWPPPLTFLEEPRYMQIILTNISDTLDIFKGGQP